jgi:hypothetical protein
MRILLSRAVMMLVEHVLPARVPRGGDRALHLPTFSHLLIVETPLLLRFCLNKASSSSSFPPLLRGHAQRPPHSLLCALNKPSSFPAFLLFLLRLATLAFALA